MFLAGTGPRYSRESRGEGRGVATQVMVSDWIRLEHQQAGALRTGRATIAIYLEVQRNPVVSNHPSLCCGVRTGQDILPLVRREWDMLLRLARWRLDMLLLPLQQRWDITLLLV